MCLLYAAVITAGVMSLSASITRDVEVIEPHEEAVAPAMSQATEPIVQDPVETAVDKVELYHKEEECCQEQLEILALIIYQEAGGDHCSDDTRRKVGSVFLNRVNSPLFPDLFAEVALAPKQYGTLHYTGLKWPDRASNPSEAEAVDRAYIIADELLRYGSILPPNVIWQAEFKQGTGVYCEQDGLYFCY